MKSMKISPLSWRALFVVLFLSGVVGYATRITFDFSAVEIILAMALALVLLWGAALRGFFSLLLVILTFWSTSVALTCSFAHPREVFHPLSTDLTLHPWVILFFTVLASSVVFYIYEKCKSPDTFPRLLLGIFLLNWAILAINTKYFSDWKLENLLTFPFLFLIYLTYRVFRLSNISYSLIFIFLILHTIGSHYTYAEVPFGYWLAQTLDLVRNHYDRIVHFSFGLLMAYPMRELAVRIGSIRGFWGLYVPVEFVLAFSAIYEIIEWIIAVVFGGDLGIAYLGTQGDEWDAIKDMALAGTGSIIAMLLVFLCLLAINRKNFLREIKKSFKVKEALPLGEEALEKILTRKK